MIDGLADLLVFDFALAGTAEIIGEIVAPQESVTALRLLAAGYHYDRGDSPVQSPPNVVATREEFDALAVAVRLPAKVLYWKYPVSLSAEHVEDLLHPPHPLERLHQGQVQQLRELPAAERAAQAQLLRIGNAAYRYHQLAEDRLTEADLRTGWWACPRACSTRWPPLVFKLLVVAGRFDDMCWNGTMSGMRPL